MIITKTPVRLSLLGGNTDLRDYFLNYGGLVLTVTIDKYIYCSVSKRIDDKIVVNYSEKEIVDDINDLRHDLVREALRLLNITKGIEISFLADIPTKGTGLGSSSACLVGLLNALHTYLGDNIGAKQLAEEAVKIELDILGKPIGLLDQNIVAVGGLRAIEFTPLGEIYCRRVDMEKRDEFNNSMMLFYTGITRKSEEILKTFDVMENKTMLDLNKHFANNGIVALLKGNFKKFGELLDTYWEMKRKQVKKVSNPEIDKMYKKAKKAGAIGGKIIGAGGGGFLFVICKPEKRIAIKQALKKYNEMPFKLSDKGSEVILNI